MRSELAEELSLDFDGVQRRILTVGKRGSPSDQLIERGVGWTRLRDRYVRGGRGSRTATRCVHDVTVDNPGGALHVTLNGAAATLSGPVQFVATWNGSKRDYIPTTSSIARSERDRPRRSAVPRASPKTSSITSSTNCTPRSTRPVPTWSRESSSDVTRPIPRRSSFGQGQELREICSRSIRHRVFEHKLSPAQQRTWRRSRANGDRPTAVILTSSPRRSHARGKAQWSWHCCSTLPRLRRAEGSFSQQAGGIGTRGPGRDPASRPTGAAS